MPIHGSKSQQESTLEAARDYVRRREWAVVPIPHGEKRCLIPNWPALRLGEADLPAYFSNGEGVGVILGEASHGLADVDLDCGEALAVADLFLPKTSAVFGRASKPRSHRVYICEPSAEFDQFKDLDGTMLLELRSTGHQTIFPPSHHSGETVAWFEDGEPLRIEAAMLVTAVRKLAAAVLLGRHWPAKGARHSAALALEGMLLRAPGSRSEQVVGFMMAVAEAAGDEELKDRLRGVSSTEARLGRNETVTGAPTLAKIIGDEVVRRVREWLGLHTRAAILWSANWPDPSPLGDELVQVPRFDLEFLPPSFRPLVDDISDRLQAPPDYAAAASVVALAGCVNRRAVIIPKQADTTWRVIPNLWGATIAPPGMMKSPIQRAVTLPLAQIEEKWRAEFESERADFEIQREQAELRLQAWREAYKQAIKKREAPPVQPDRTLREPRQGRLVLTDATVEKLHEILAQNPAGVLVIRDELTGWLSELERSGREGERAFFLQGWNGDAGFTIDRIGRGSIYVPAVCVSLLGNIQPGRLRSYLGEVIHGGPGDDGLFQRFQISVWPDPPRDWKLVDRPANDVALRTARRVFESLANLSANDPVRMRFAPDAQQLFFEWWSELEFKIRGDSSLAPAFVAHLSKFRSLMPTLAGLFELADRVAAADGLGPEIEISLEHGKQAAALCKFLEAHAGRIYASLISPEIRSARELLRHVQAGALGEKFTTREIYRRGWTGLDTAERVRGALSFLEELAWIRRFEAPTMSSGGRPSEVWAVNPKGAARA